MNSGFVTKARPSRRAVETAGSSVSCLPSASYDSDVSRALSDLASKTFKKLVCEGSHYA